MAKSAVLVPFLTPLTGFSAPMFELFPIQGYGVEVGNTQN